MSKPIRRFNLNFKNNLGPGTYTRRVIESLWAQLEGYFNIEVGSQNSTDITYTYGPKQTGPSTGGNGGVQLRGRFVSDEEIMHETFHALGYMKHSNLSGQFTVRGRPFGGPALRIQDFITLQRRFGVREWDSERTEFSWGAGDKPLTFRAYRTTSNGVGGPQQTTVRNLYENFLYDFVWRDTGYNILNFQNFSTQLRIDLRASELTQNSVINGRRLFGTMTSKAGSWFGLNIINVPGVKLDEARGGSSDDVIVGNERDNKLFGNAGRDTLCGLRGNDTLDGGADTNTVDYSRDASEGGNSGILVNMTTKNIGFRGKFISAGTALDGFGSIDTLISIQNIIGTAFADYIVGSDASNVLVGGAGNDSLNGGDGIDTVDYSGDRIAGGTAPVFVSLLAGTVRDGFGNEDVLVSIENVIGTDVEDFIVGDGGANVLEGRGGADSLNGAGGADIMIGGAGHDSYWVNDVSDQVIESLGNGSDTVHASIDYMLPDHVEHLWADNAATTGLSLTGNALNNELRGSRFDDVLFGNVGVDGLDGREGDDLLIGGADQDYFLYKLNYGADIIRDFTLAGNGPVFDRLLISKSLVSDYVTLMSYASQVGSSIRFDFGQGNTLTLENMNMDPFKFQRYLGQVTFVEL